MSNADQPNGFPRELRLRRPADYERVYAAKCSASDRNVVMYAAPNELGHARLGLSVGRKVGNAVVRQRLKRLIRETFRLSKGRLPSGVDLVVIPRRTILAELGPLGESLVTLANQLARRLAGRDR